MANLANWGTPIWQVDFTCPGAPLPQRTDVAVVGAGFTGLSAAYHIRRAHPAWRVTVLEAETVGSGASGRTGGIVLDDTAAGPVPDFAGSLEFAHQLLTREHIDCGWNTPGCWEVAHRRNLPKKKLDWHDQGAPLRVSAVVPGGTVDPGRLVAGLARAVRRGGRAGAAIHERCPVESLEFGEPLRLRVADREIAADWVVLATNAYFTEFSEIEQQGAPLLTLAVATGPIAEANIHAAGLGPRIPFYTKDLPYLWGRLTAGNRLVLGSGLVAAGEGGVTAVSLGASEAPAMFEELEARARGLHPALAGIRFTHRWAGPIVITDDWRPILREHSRSPRVLVAGGYSGHGVAQSIRMGELIARKIGF